jgi:hypothetical protein
MSALGQQQSSLVYHLAGCFRPEAVTGSWLNVPLGRGHTTGSKVAIRNFTIKSQFRTRKLQFLRMSSRSSNRIRVVRLERVDSIEWFTSFPREESNNHLLRSNVE